VSSSNTAGVCGSKIAVFADSACSVPAEDVEKYGIRVIPLQVVYPDGSTYRDLVEIQPHEIYDRLHEAVPSTSLPFASDFLKAVEEVRAQGCTAIVGVTLGSVYSGTCDLFRRLLAEQTDMQSFVIDTYKLDYGAGVAAVMACKLIEQGVPFEQLEQRLLDLGERSGALVTVSTLEHLIRGGRIGRAKGMVGTLLRVRPVLACTTEGLKTLVQTRGDKAARKRMVEEIADRVRHCPRVVATVAHTACTETAEYVKNLLREAIPHVQVRIAEASAVIGVHTGPGAVGVCYQGLCDGDPW